MKTVTQFQEQVDYSTFLGSRFFCSLEELSYFVSERRRVSGSKIAFTSGCFDLFHYGHLVGLTKMVRASRANGCSIFIVGINEDSSIISYKGKPPIVPLMERASLVSLVSGITAIIPFSEPHPKKIVDKIEPELILHGTSAGREPFLDSRELDSFNGSLLVVEHESGWSSTGIRKKIVEMEK